MTHYTVAVIVPPYAFDDPEAFATEQMEPYDEGHVVPPYVAYSVERAASDIAATIHRHEQIIRRKKQSYDLDKCRQEIERLRNTSPEDWFREVAARYERHTKDGQPLSTANPQGKWDWFAVGGRWDGWINDRQSRHERMTDNAAMIADVIARRKIPHAIITPDGMWHERGRMGWFATLHTEDEHWEENALALFAQYPEHQVILLDAHV